MYIAMGNQIANGTKKVINNKPCIYYDGYWIRQYEVNSDSLATKKQTIDQLTKRVFHHVEPGINTPGYRLDEIRDSYQRESDPARKRVKGAMLAGALLNRSSDILTTIVGLEEAGVKIESSNELLRECGRYFMEALELGKNIKLSRGGEGLDELWGEPFKVFSMPIDAFFESRYIKIAQTMFEIDQITNALITISAKVSGFEDFISRVKELGESAKLACETLRSDSAMFEIWPRYVAAKEQLDNFTPEVTGYANYEEKYKYKKARQLIHEGGEFLSNLATIRVPMPNTTSKFLQKCNDYCQEL
ncbi:MAG: hypothetical protein AAB221_05855 [Bacteroidota bacterium]